MKLDKNSLLHFMLYWFMFIRQVKLQCYQKRLRFNILVIAWTNESSAAWSFYKAGGIISPAFEFASNFWDQLKMTGAVPLKFIWLYTVIPFFEAAFAYSILYSIITYFYQAVNKYFLVFILEFYHLYEYFYSCWYINRSHVSIVLLISHYCSLFIIEIDVKNFLINH